MEILSDLLDGKLKRAPMEMKIADANKELIQNCQGYQHRFRNEEFFKSFNFGITAYSDTFRDFESIQ